MTGLAGRIAAPPSWFRLPRRTARLRLTMLYGSLFTVCGAGLANLYPLSLALTLAAAPGNGDTANARTQLLGGILVVAAPYLLGTLADHFGLHAAFTIEPVLIAAAALLLLTGLRRSPRT